MYSKNEASLIKKEFWTQFGKYMKPVWNAAGETINWINYKTGIKHIYIRTDVSKRQASVAMELSHPVAAERQESYKKLKGLQAIFDEHVQGTWSWQENIYDEHGLPMSRIVIQKENVNIFNKEDWPEIISFLKQHLIALDAFWLEIKDVFEI